MNTKFLKYTFLFMTIVMALRVHSQEEDLPPSLLDEAPDTEVSPLTNTFEIPPTENNPTKSAPAEGDSDFTGVDAPSNSGDPKTPRPQETIEITNMRFVRNESGGTFLIESSAPLDFQTKTNPENSQVIIEVMNALLPNRLKRPFPLRDMPGGLGSVDAYQTVGSSTARIVVQLKSGAPEPVIQAEGNSILVISQTGQPNGSEQTPLLIESNDSLQEVQSAETPAETSGKTILSSASLEEFLKSNNRFYGKKISIETTDMDIRTLFKVISEESGLNLVLAQNVSGKVSIKLRQVPWDQALVVIMKAYGLSYTRSGNVLRIAPLKDIQNEEELSINLEERKKKSTANMKVRMIPVSYANPETLQKQVVEFVSKEITVRDNKIEEKPIGKVVADTRISALIVSDTDEAIARIEKVVKSLDVPPRQVLIEGKVVEAKDSFSRNIGVNWSVLGTPLGRNGNLNVSSFPVGSGTTSSFGVGLQLGRLSGLGDLAASLSLFEREGTVKVLSSPRILTLHNEKASIDQQIEIPIQATTISSGTPTTSVSFKPVKLNLTVMPSITNSGDVLLDVDVSRQFLGEEADPTTKVRPINTRAAKSKVMVKNGQTAVIGGIYQNDMQKSTTKVPLLGDIPIVGWLFKNESNTEDKNELLIFLTPRVVGSSSDLSSLTSSGVE
jgi:type IV pilus assembly protein PilQ